MRVLRSENINYLHLISFANFSLWDTKRYTSQQLSSTFPIVKLGDCIIEQNKKYKIFEEEEKEFGILGVNNKEGIFDAYKQKGKEINQPYKKMETGWLAYNPYRINVGSIGIKLKEHEHEFISPAYVVFSCKQVLLPEFLFLLFKTDTFNKVINESTTGSVRQNLTFETLKSLEIPLPSIEEQNKIVAAYQEKIQLAEQQAKQANELEAEIKRYLMEELGVGVNEKTKHQGLNFIKLSSIDRWDIWNKNISFNSSEFNLVSLKQILSLKSGSFLPASKMVKGKYDVYGGNGKNGVHNEFILEGKRLVIGRVGEYCGNVHLVDGKYWVTDNAFIVDKLTDKVSFEYLEIALRQLDINKFKVMSAQPSISQSTILELEIPIPPEEKQNEIFQHINKIKLKIQELNNFCLNNKENAIQEFENVIFS